MENENFEEITEEVIQNGTSENVETSMDDIGEERTDDSNNNSSVLSSLDDISSSLTSEQSLEQLLREYFSGSREASLDNTEDGAQEGASEGASDIDYTELLNEILSVSEDSASYESSVLSYLEEYKENNTLSSELDSISLTNALLLFVCVCILALAAINFSRRIL